MYSKRAAQYHDLGDSVQIQEETIKKNWMLFRYAYIFFFWLMVVVVTVPKNSNNNRVFSYLTEHRKNQWLVKIFDIFFYLRLEQYIIVLLVHEYTSIMFIYEQLHTIQFDCKGKRVSVFVQMLDVSRKISSC